MTTGANRGRPNLWERALPFDPASVPAARRQIGSTLRDYGVDSDTADDAMLVLTELVSNALRHARPLPSGTLRVRCAVRRDVVRIEVTDGGASTRPHIVNPPVTALGGRGLSIVSELAQSWGVRPGRPDEYGDPRDPRDGDSAERGDGGAVTVYAYVPVGRSSGDVG